MLIDHESHVISIKVVFYGPAMSGKTTMVRWLFDALGLADRLSSVENNVGRTMFFDFGTIPIPLSQEWTVVAHFWTATGQDYYMSTRSTVLAGVDGLIFVADSQPRLIDDDLRAWTELHDFLNSTQYLVPMVVCLNKQDLSEAMDEATIRQCLCIPENTPVFRVVANNGLNVAEAVHSVIREIMRTTAG